MAEVNTSSSYSEGGFKVDRLLVYSNSGGQGIDIASMDAFLELVINESLFSAKLYGEILIRDTLNLSETIPIVGNERVEITYRTTGNSYEPVTIRGYITAPLGKARADGEKTEVYKLQFVTETNFLNRFLTVESALSGTITDMASRILTDNFKSRLDVNIKTTQQRKYVIPRWTPLFTISWLATRAFSDSKYSFYSFYEDVDGFHFKEVLDETQKKPKITFRVEPMNAGNLSDVDLYMSRVLSYSITSYFDRLDEFQGGMYSGLLNTHDITTKKFEQGEFDYTDYTSNSGWKSLNGNPLRAANQMSELYTQKGKPANRVFVPLQTLKDEGIKDNDQYGKYSLSKRSIEKQFTAMRMTIIVPGNSSLRLMDTVGFEIPKIGYMDESTTDYLDPFLSGKYMIMSLKHVLNRKDGYKTTIEMSKDSLIRQMPYKIDSTNYK